MNDEFIDFSNVTPTNTSNDDPLDETAEIRATKCCGNCYFYKRINDKHLCYLSFDKKALNRLSSFASENASKARKTHYTFVCDFYLFELYSYKNLTDDQKQILQQSGYDTTYIPRITR